MNAGYCNEVKSHREHIGNELPVPERRVHRGGDRFRHQMNVDFGRCDRRMPEDGLNHTERDETMRQIHVRPGRLLPNLLQTYAAMY